MASYDGGIAGAVRRPKRKPSGRVRSALEHYNGPLGFMDDLGEALAVSAKPWQSGSLKRLRLDPRLVVCQAAGARLARPFAAARSPSRHM
jgi:hypothetical protein